MSEKEKAPVRRKPRKNDLRECFSDPNVKIPTHKEPANNNNDAEVFRKNRNTNLVNNNNNQESSGNERKRSATNQLLSPDNGSKAAQRKRSSSSTHDEKDKILQHPLKLELNSGSSATEDSKKRRYSFLKSNQRRKESTEAATPFPGITLHVKDDTERSAFPGIPLRAKVIEKDAKLEDFPFPGIPLHGLKLEKKEVRQHSPFPGIPLHNIPDSDIRTPRVSSDGSHHNNNNNNNNQNNSEDKIEKIATKTERKRRSSVIVSISGLFNRNSPSHMEDETHRAAAKIVLDYSDSDKQKLIQAQSWIRTIFTKKTVAQLGTKDQIAKRYDAIQELISNEQKYIELLQIIVEGYVTPLKAQIKPQYVPSLPGDVIYTMFYNIEEIFNYHKNFINSLIYRLESWPVCNISKFLLEFFSKFTTLYEKLASNISAAEKLLDQYYPKRSFKGFLDTNSQIYQNALAPTLKKMLSYPPKHIPTYTEIVKKILFTTPENTEHFSGLVESVAIITQFTKYIQERVEFEDLLTIESLLDTSAKKVELPIPKRQFILEGKIAINSVPKAAFLFNDILLLTTNKGKRYKVDEIILLKNANIKDTSGSNDGKKLFSNLEYGSNKKVELEEVSTYETSFIKLLSDFIIKNKDPIFGSPLNATLENEKGEVPNIVMKTIYHLDKLPMKMGLFRSLGNPSIIAKIQMDEAIGGNDFNSIHRDDIAAILLLYLELLPEPIIGFDPIDSIFSTFHPSDKIIMLYLKKVISNMSENMRNLIEYLSYFLQRLSSTGNLSSLELSLYFAPYIIKPKEPSIAYCNAIPTINRMIDLMVRKSGELFKVKDNSGLPRSVEELFKSESFGVWWKEFRSKEKSFVKFITKDKSFTQLFSLLLDLKSIDVNNHFGHLAVHVLTNDWVSDYFIEKKSLLDEYFGLLNEKITELAMKNFCEVTHSLFAKKNCAKLIEYFQLETNNANMIIISQIGSGNISNMLNKIMDLSKLQAEIGIVLSKWGICCLDKLMVTEYSYESSFLQNIAQYICDLLHQQHYVNSPHSSTFLHQLHILCETSNLFSKSISGENPQTCSTLISIIIAVITKKLTYLQKSISSTSIRDDAVKIPMSPSTEFQMEELRQSLTEVVDDEEDNSIAIVITPAKSDKKEKEKEKEEKEEDEDSDSDDEENSLNFKTPLCHLSAQEKGVDLSATFLTKLIMQHKLIESVLAKQTPTLGPLKLSLVQLVQALVFINSPVINDELPKTKLLDSCLQLFVAHPLCSILQCIIRDTITFLLESSNEILITHIIQDTSLIPVILNANSKNPPNVACFLCHLEMIKNTLEKNVVSLEVLKKSSHWPAWQPSAAPVKEKRKRSLEKTSKSKRNKKKV